MRKLLLIIALAWPGSHAWAAACDTTGRLNGFDMPGACTGVAEVGLISSSQALTSVAGGTVTGLNVNVEGTEMGLINTGVVAIGGLGVTVTAANFASGLGTDFSSRQFISFASGTTRTATANSFKPDIHFNNGGTNYIFSGVQVSTMAALSAASDWTYQILSLNYARNLGVPVANIQEVGFTWNKLAVNAPFSMAFDDLAVYGSGGTPNAPLPVTAVAGTASCSPHNITISPQTMTAGADPITGYHVYRSTSGPGGPYVSHRYVNSAPWAFTETAPFYNNVYYKILPYSGTTTQFNGSGSGTYAKASNATLDPVNSQIPANNGVFEADLSSAAAAGPFNQLAACPPTPTPTFTPTATITMTSTFTPTVTLTATPTFTPTVTPTITQTDTPGPSATFTVTFTIAPPTSTFTPPPTSTITMTYSPGPTLTITPTITVTPVVTSAVVVGIPAQLYPNPFNPDKELFYLGNVPAGSQMNIYNLIGEKVYSVRLQGNPSLDYWDGLNNNGVKVVTGIYFVVIDGNVYRLAVVRN